MATFLFDTETDGLLDTVTKIHCLVIKDVETGEVRRFVERGDRMGSHLVIPCIPPGHPARYFKPLDEIPLEVGPDGFVQLKREPLTYIRCGWLEEGIALLQEADAIAGHNIVRFDIPVIQKFFPWFKPKGKVRDTIIMARLIWPNLKVLDKKAKIADFPGNLVGRHSLEAWGRRLGSFKGDFGKKEDAWKTFTPEMLEYCVQDVEGPTTALWNLIQKKQYSEEAIQNEHDFAYIMFLQELHGFRFDEKAAQKLHATLVKRRLELEAQLQATFKGWWEDMKTPEYYLGDRENVQRRFATKGEAKRLKATNIVAGPWKQKHMPFNPASRDHVARILKEAHGWTPKQFTDGGKPQIDESVLEGLDFPEAKLLLESFMLDKRLGQLAEGDNAWLKLVGKDGRMHGQVDTMGTVTSRCSHMRPNMGQVPACDKPFGSECRALFLPNEGHVLVGADASGIQLRALAHYLSRWDDGKYVGLVTTGDVHTANQQAAGIPTRDMAKTFIYAWLLGAGDAKVGKIVGKGTKAGRELKQRFLKNLPAFKKLKDRIAERVDQGGSITGLDGRVMPVESAHLALGSLLQGFEAVVMKKATHLLYTHLTSKGYQHGPDFGFCAMVHDEWQISARKDIADEVGTAAGDAIRRAGEYFESKCPLAGAYKIGGNWAETH